jgi:hypothetical protein
MDLSIRRAGHLVILAALLFTGCLAAEERPIPHEPEKPIVRVSYGTHFTPRGTEVEVPEYFAKREELLLLAFQEIDNLGFHRELQGWIVRVVRPTDVEEIDRKGRMIFVQWRAEDHQPSDQMLPHLQRLLDQAAP